ncbi:hypothetical protein D3C76_1130770 [compost metagenome]
MFAFPLRHQGGGGDPGVLRLARLRLGLRQLRLEHLGIHARDDLADLHEVAFVHQDFRHPPGQLGRHVHFGGLDAPVAAGEAFAEPVGSEGLPGQRGGHRERYGDHSAKRPASGVSSHRSSLISAAFAAVELESLVAER